MPHFLKLENGRELQFLFRHNPPRATYLWFWDRTSTDKTACDGIGTARTHPKDRFCRKTGRLVATRDLLRQLPSDTYPPELKRQILKFLFPALSLAKKKGRAKRESNPPDLSDTQSCPTPSGDGSDRDRPLPAVDGDGKGS